MKFMAEKGIESRRKEKSTETMEPAQLSASVKPVNQASVPQRVLCERDQAG